VARDPRTGLVAFSRALAYAKVLGYDWLGK
jgi:hypothetical protein